MSRILAYGLPGSGKSTLLHDLVAAQCHEIRFMVVDHEAGWGSDGVHWRGRPPPIELHYKGQPLPSLEQWPDTEAGVVHVFRGYDGREVAELCKQLGWCTYVDDEFDKAGRREGFDTSALRAIVNEGRHLENAAGEYTEVNLIGACRRPQKLHNDVSELADQVYIFRCQGNRTIGRLLDDNHILESQVDEVQNLPNFSCIHWPSRKRQKLRAVKGRPDYQPRAEELDADAA